MPFESAYNRDKSALTSFFENHLKKPIEEAELTHKYLVRRSGEALNITDEIFRELYRADIVIADLSGELPNPNVMFELGVRFAMTPKPVILIREKNDKNRRIFDVAHLYTHEYSPYEYPRLEHHIVEKIRRLETGEEQYESPVRRALEGYLATASEEDFRRLPSNQQREIVLAGIRTAEEVVTQAFGPLGQGLAYTDTTGAHRLAMRGNEILEALPLMNPLEQHAVQLLRKAASSIHNRYRDGSKFAVIIARELMEAGHQAVQQGRSYLEFISGMDQGITAVLEQLRVRSEPPTKAQVLSTVRNASREKTIAEKALKLVDQVGPDGIITLEQSAEGSEEITIDNGFVWDRGYASTNFVSPHDSDTYALENCLVLLCDEGIKDVKNLIPVLEVVREQARPLLIVAVDVAEEALAILVQNNRENILRSVVVKPLANRQHPLAFFEDCHFFTGASIISATTGRQLEKVKLTDLGTASTVTVGADTTQIKGGGGATSAIEAHVQTIRKQMKTADPRSQHVLRARLARLVGSQMRVQVSGVTAFEVQQKLDAWQTALGIIDVVNKGISLGGGIGLLQAGEGLKNILAETDAEGDGLLAVANAVAAPLKVLALSAGLSTDEVVRSIEAARPSSRGVNVIRASIEDLRESGIYDPTETLCYALELARSIACEFLQTSTWVVRGNDELYTIKAS